jgi:hypothetical protein
MVSIHQSALAQSPAASGLDLKSEIIFTTGYCRDIAWLTGTRGALESEGVIPENMYWPSGFSEHAWQAGPLKYTICRKRPAGIKGPRRNFLEIDWWSLRIEPVIEPDRAARAIAQKTQELRDAIYAHSPQGIAERSRMFKLSWKAIMDDDFQAFKAKIPGLIPPPRPTRQAKAQGEAA